MHSKPPGSVQCVGFFHGEKAKMPGPGVPVRIFGIEPVDVGPALHGAGVQCGCQEGGAVVTPTTPERAYLAACRPCNEPGDDGNGRDAGVPGPYRLPRMSPVDDRAGRGVADADKFGGIVGFGGQARLGEGQCHERGRESLTDGQDTVPVGRPQGRDRVVQHDQVPVQNGLIL